MAVVLLTSNAAEPKRRARRVGATYDNVRFLVERVSSTLTPLYRWAAPCIAAGAFVAAVRIIGLSVLSSLLSTAVGIAILSLWWRYLRPAKEVYMNEIAIWVRGGDEDARISYEKVRDVRSAATARFPSVVITYMTDSGEPGTVVFIPSHRRYYSVFGSGKIEALVQAVRKRVSASVTH